MTMRTSSLVALVLCSVIGACAPAPGATQAGSAPGARNNVLTQAQLSATNSMNLYDAIPKLHPDWLSSRGPTSVTDATATSVSIFMGGTMLGKAEALRDVPVIDVAEVRYWDAGQAAARFGMGHPRGVIEITRK
jgi:hypothetical protein